MTGRLQLPRRLTARGNHSFLRTTSSLCLALLIVSFVLCSPSSVVAAASPLQDKPTSSIKNLRKHKNKNGDASRSKKDAEVKGSKIQPKIAELKGSKLKPKMNGKAIDSEFHKTSTDLVEKIHSKVAYFPGKCSKAKPFQFSIGGASGSFVIGSLAGTDEMKVSFDNSDEEGKITTKASNEKNFFALPQGDNYLGTSYQYKGMTSKELSLVNVDCDQEKEVDIIVIVGDSTQKVADASVTHSKGKFHFVVEEDESSVDLYTQSISPSGGGTRRLRTMEQSSNSILLESKIRTLEKHDNGSKDVECTLIQMTLHDAEGYAVPKTIVLCGGQENIDRRNRKLQAEDNIINLESSDIDVNGDLILKFKSLPHFELEEANIKLEARIGITSVCLDEVIEIVDMSAMLSPNEPTLVVNGGWFRRATKLHDITDCDWEPVIVDAIVTDPNAKYIQVGRLDHLIEATVMKDNRAGRGLSLHELNDRRKLLKAPPSAEEMSINDEMTRGRKPEHFISPNSSRNLEDQIHKKILVHGYCDTGSPFPVSHFTDAVEFDDPDSSGPNSWTLDEFANKIGQFAMDEGIYGCGIIAHSQGGMAALHLYQNYYSCLDYANGGGTRMIQSVGTPYQGTTLAGNLASLGYAFNQGCGYNYDLTETGATEWLRGISYWARKEVYYFTTGFTDNWWSWDYCLLATELILNDPEDGVVEKSRGQLYGGNNLGHTEGQCHTVDMYEMAQYEDYSRNRKMNSNARI
jgi:hypothetical protein